MNERDRHLWYKHAVLYGLDVATLQDSNGDESATSPRLISRLDYVADLGVTCLWLLPFFPSPNRDNGYDVTLPGMPMLVYGDEIGMGENPRWTAAMRSYTDAMVLGTPCEFFHRRATGFDGARRDQRAV